jgi:hypothetical protein
MEKIIMSKIDTPNDHRPFTPLADSELDAVSGGSVGQFIGGIAAGILDGPSLDKLAIAVANAIGRASGGGW